MYNEWFRGQNRSKNEQNGFDSLVNCDVHTTLGEAKPQLALTTDSTTPNEACISVIVSNGDVFFFSTESGKIWKRTEAGVYSLVHTNAQGSNVGAYLWQGYLYYATTAKLGRTSEANASSEATWSSQDDAWATFSNSGTYKPMCEVGSALYIGDDYYVASVDSSHTFTADALDIPSTYTASVLADVNGDLGIGTIIGANVPYCKFFIWDRFSPSWNNEDRVSEIGINCIVRCDNLILAQCGTAGQIYYWNGSQMLKFKKIRGVTTTVNSQNSTEYKGRPLFAVGTKIFSIHREDQDFPFAVVQEYTAASTVKSLIGKTNDLLVSSNKIEHVGTGYGTVTIDTPELVGKANDVEVQYDTYPDGIAISTKVNGGDWTEKTPIIDTQRNVVHFDGGLGQVNFIQARITLTPSGSDYPIIKGISIV